MQARMGSTRLPGKVLLKVKGVPLLQYELSRVRLAKEIDAIVVATTTEKQDDAIEKLCKKIRIDCFRGSNEDVLDRYYQCSLQYPTYRSIVRITGDCPLHDPVVADETIRLFKKSGCDYACNILRETFPDGMDTEVFTQTALAESAARAELRSEREHVTLYIRNQEKFKKENLAAPYAFSHFRFTVDNPEDFEVVKFLIEGSSLDAQYLDYISLLTKYPHIMMQNMHIKRNEGLAKSLCEDRVLRQ